MCIHVCTTGAQVFHKIGTFPGFEFWERTKKVCVIRKELAQRSVRLFFAALEEYSWIWGSLLPLGLIFICNLFFWGRKNKNKKTMILCVIYFISVQFCSLVNFLKLSASFSLLLKVLSSRLSLSLCVSLMYSWIIWFSCIHFVSLQYIFFNHKRDLIVTHAANV